MNEHFEYLTLTQLGKVFGASPNQVGRWLVEVGLRTNYLKPTQQALNGGFTKLVTLEDGSQFVSWHQEKTLQALEGAGHCRIDATAIEQGVAPFSAKMTGDSEIEISDSNGLCCCTAKDKTIAAKLVRLLNREPIMPRSANEMDDFKRLIAGF